MLMFAEEEHDVQPVGATAGADQASVAESTQSASNKAVSHLALIACGPRGCSICISALMADESEDKAAVGHLEGMLKV